MPEGRPFKTVVFLNRDEAHFAELNRLNSSVVLHTGEPELELAPDLIASYAAQTGLVTKEEINVGVLNRGKYLISLPQGLSPETFIQKTPVEVWDLGFEFQQWTALEESAIIIPSFKLLLALEDLPPYLWRENYVTQAVSSMGTYLGSVAPPDPANLKQYLVVIATDDLQRISQHVGLRAGGIEHLLTIKVLKISTGTIYGPRDLPQLPRKFGRPEQPYSSPDSSDGEEGGFRDDMIPVSRRALEEICKGRDISELPEVVRAFLAGGESSSQPEVLLRATENHRKDTRKQIATDTQPETVYQSATVVQSAKTQTGKPRNMPNTGQSDAAGQTTTRNDPPHGRTNVPRQQQERLANQSKPGQNHPRRILQRTAAETTHLKGQSYPVHREKEVDRQQEILEEVPIQHGDLNQNENLPQRVRTRPEKRQQPEGPRKQSKDKNSSSMGRGQGRPWGKRGARVTHATTRALHVSHNRTTSGEASTSTMLKRKTGAQNQAQEASGPSKKMSAQAKNNEFILQSPNQKQAQCKLNENGLYEVQVDYSHCLNLANNMGVDPELIVQTIRDDNTQRENQAKSPQILTEEELANHMRRFDPDSEDELDPEFE